MKTHPLLALVTLVPLLACTGELVPIDRMGEDVIAAGPDAGGAVNDGTPTAVFSADVNPMLRAQCTACHETGGIGPVLFGAPGEADDYSSTTSNTTLHGGFSAASATLITKGAHSGVSWWTAGQISTITAWLDAEGATR